jgi:hypothetical protein
VLPTLGAVSAQSSLGRYQRLVLDAIGHSARTPQELATQLDEPLPDVHRALVGLVEAGMAEAHDGRVWLTEAGRLLLTAQASPSDDLVDVARALGTSWAAHAAHASAERKLATDALLASDEDRDRAVQQLAEAFSQGRLAAAELDERTGRALAARTHGDLDAALAGLGGLSHPVARHPVRSVVFWVATVLLSPLVLVSGLFALFGSDLGDHIAGLVFLAIAAMPLYGLWRWSRPRR